MYDLDISHNKITSLKAFEDYFPGLTVLDVSHNDILDVAEFEFMIYLDTISEIDVEGNDFFVKGSEKDLHEAYPFLERINGRVFYTTGERERQQKEKIIEEMRWDGLISAEEARALRSQNRRKYEDEIEIDQPEGELSLLKPNFLKINPEKSKKFYENNSALEEFAEHAQQDFERHYRSFYQNVDRIETRIRDTQHSLNQQFAAMGVGPPFSDFVSHLKTQPLFAAADLQPPQVTPDGQASDSGLTKARSASTQQETPSTVETRKDPERRTKPESGSMFETKPSSSSLLGEGREPKPSFRVRTYSREQGSRRGEKEPAACATGPKAAATSNSNKLSVNWAQKDLKKQNEEILKMLERNRIDLGPLQRVPRKLAAPASKKLG